MIRPEAAQKLAESILEPFIKLGVCKPLSIDTVAKLISVSVQEDELSQKLDEQIKEMS